MQVVNSLINEEAELVVIGTLIANEQSHKKLENIEPVIFSSNINLTLFNVIKKIVDEGKQVDIPLLYERIKDSKISISIASLTNIALYSNIYTFDQNIQILEELYKKRNLFEKAEALKQGIIENKDLDKLIFDFENQTKDIVDIREYKDDISSISSRLFDSLEAKGDTGFSFGIPILDKIIGGLFKGELTTIGAKSGVGKTAMALCIVQEALKQNKRVLVVTREMTDEHITQRLITQQTGVSSKVLKKRAMNENDWSDIVNSLSYLGSKELYINHNISTPTEIRKRVRELKPDLVVIDYLQLLTSENKGKGREQEVAYLSREMKKITTDFKTSVVQLTQLNESFRGRPNGESAVRESRSIYHDSNNVVYIHKPIEYEELLKLANEKEETAKLWEDMNSNSPTKLYEVIVSKCRDGGSCIEKMWYVGEKLSFQKYIN